jgi:N-acyl-D-aspartate/D-glutamate deacylase
MTGYFCAVGQVQEYTALSQGLTTVIAGNCGISAAVETILNISHSQQSEGAQHEHQAVWR